MIAPTYHGEATDRVIQWTYWNSNYLALENTVGSHDCRANVTMEGCYDGLYTADIIS